MIVQYCATCIAEMLHNTKHRDSPVNIPLSPDQHHCSDEAKWRIGGLCLGDFVTVTAAVGLPKRLWNKEQRQRYLTRQAERWSSGRRVGGDRSLQWWQQSSFVTSCHAMSLPLCSLSTTTDGKSHTLWRPIMTLWRSYRFRCFRLISI